MVTCAEREEVSVGERTGGVSTELLPPSSVEEDSPFSLTSISPSSSFFQGKNFFRFGKESDSRQDLLLAMMNGFRSKTEETDLEVEGGFSS